MKLAKVMIHIKTRIRAAVVALTLILVFGIGVYLSKLMDDRLLALIKDVQGHLKRTYGISVVIGSSQLGVGNVTLSEVSLGESSWLVVDNVKIGVSLNPFADFLRPSTVSIGKAAVKLPWRRDLWPKEIQLLAKILQNRSQDGGTSTKGGGSLMTGFIPKLLEVRAARIEFADDNTAKILGENVNFRLRTIDKSISATAGHISILEDVNEDLVAFSASRLGEDSEHFMVSGRLAKDEKPTWEFDCEVRRVKLQSTCRVNATRLPHSLVGHFQRYFGSGFAPSYSGTVTMAKSLNSIGQEVFNSTVDGTFGQIYVEHPALALTSIGPSFVKTAMNLEIDLSRRRLKILKSSAFLYGKDPSQSRVPQDHLPIDLSGEIIVTQKSDKKRVVNGHLTLDIPSTSCQSGFNAIPKTFIPDLDGVKLRGSAELHLKANFVDGGAQFDIHNSRFDCVTSAVPEIYSGTYLNGPFNIERSLAGGKVYIPVDPARPYFASYREIPKLVRDAFVSSEDAGFFAHKGVEMSAILGAVERNAEEGRAAVGGSTITMQTVKNLFLARDKTMSRKAQELFLAWHIERTISKERILEIYLNMVEFGPGLYGLGLASQRFFDKSPQSLSLKEAIYLASLLPAPVPRYRYFCEGRTTANYDRIVKQLLDRMLGLGRISFEQHANAVAEKLQFSASQRESSCGKNRMAEMDKEDLSEAN